MYDCPSNFFDKLPNEWQNEHPHFELKEKVMSKQMSRKQKQRERNRSRMPVIVMITVGALLIALALILPNIKTGTEVTLPEAVSGNRSRSTTMSGPA